MTAILAEFAHFLTLASAVRPNQAFPIILGLVLITSMAVGCAIVLKKT